MPPFRRGDTVELIRLIPGYGGTKTLRLGDRVKVKKTWQTSLPGSYGFDFRRNGKDDSGICSWFKKVEVESDRLPTWAVGSLVYATVIKIGFMWHFFNR
jgi:hypothetical protein